MTIAPCHAGFYCPEGSAYAIPCPDGHYCEQQTYNNGTIIGNYKFKSIEIRIFFLLMKFSARVLHIQLVYGLVKGILFEFWKKLYNK